MNDRQFIKFKKWQRSRKDYRHVFAAAPTPLPPQLLFVSPILSQDGNKCSAFFSVSARASMKGGTYDPQWQWQQELQFEGVSSAPDGVSFKTPFAVGCEMGFYDVLKKIATDKAAAYFFVHPQRGQDWFDAIKGAINEVQGPLGVALDWYTDWDVIGGMVPHSAQHYLGGHLTKIAGWKTINGTDVLVIQNSWGPDMGDNGLFYFDRYMVNAYFGKYGVAYWGDSANTQIQKLGLLQALYQNLLALIASLNARTNGAYPPKTAFYWNTPAAARHSVRVICDQEGLSWNDKNILDACVHVESGYNPLAIHPNKDISGKVWSTDYGICQINDYWNIGAGKTFPTSDFVLQNPEASVRFMCRMWKAGKQNLWASWTSGLYKQYLTQ
jgi:hypothetical protein